MSQLKAAPDSFPNRNCVSCHGQMTTVTEDLTYEYEGVTLVLKGISMSVCPSCGDRYIPGPIALKISDLVAEITKLIRSQIQDSPIALPRRFEYEANQLWKAPALASA